MINKNDILTRKILVSVIIPAYNVAEYIEKCILSILTQSYSNVEIIVVNDGSNDGTKMILDEFAMRDDRIIVKHKPNSGVSAARNSGLEICQGDYIVFVDGDDYISKDYIEYMLSLLYETKTKFALSINCFTRYNQTQPFSQTVSELSAEEATALLLSPKVIVGCWNKIYSRDLIFDHNLQFSTSLFYGEGLTFITTISQLVDFVGVGNRRVYYYRRNNMSSATTKFSISKLNNGEIAIQGIRDNIKVKSKKIDTMFRMHKTMYSLGAVVRILASGSKGVYRKEYQKWRKYLVKNTIKLLFEKDISVYRKCMLLGGCLSPRLMVLLDRYRRKKIIRDSVL